MKQAQIQRRPAQPKAQALQRQEAAPQHSPVAHSQPVQDSLSELPVERSARGLRQSAVLQMQQAYGNAFVQRQILDGDSESTAQAPTESQPAGGAGTAATELSDGGSTVSVGGGGVQISGGMVNVDAPMTRVAGVLNADTVVANSVVSSTYTPGVGNVM